MSAPDTGAAAPTDRPGGGRWSPDTVGALYVLTAGVSFMLSVGVIKHMAADMPLGVLVFWRSLLALVPFLPAIVRSRGGLLRTRRPLGHVWRALVGFSSFFGFVWAVSVLPLGDAVALSYTSPLWSTLLAVVLLGERLGTWRVAALLIGFAGVLLIAKPTGSVHPAVAIGLGAAVCTSLAMLAVRRLSAEEPPDRIAFYFLLMGTLFSIPLAAADWRWPVGGEWGWLVVLGVLTTVIQMALSRGYAIGTFSRMAPVEYVRLPIALALGWFAFGEAPDGWSLLGTVVIACASLYVVLGGTRGGPAGNR